MSHWGPRAVVIALTAIALSSPAWGQDCNHNGIPDACDIDCGPPGGPCDVPGCGQSLDCQPNGIPDECEVNLGQIAKLRPVAGAAGDRFGQSVGVSGALAVLGAPYNGHFGTASGAAYVFGYHGGSWVQEAELLPADGASYDYFGYSVAIAGGVVVVGAYGGDDFGSESGSAYVFHYVGGNWVQEAKLLAADGAGGDHFGFSVAVSGDVVVVGANWDDDLGANCGSAFVFRRVGSTWVQEAKLLPSDGADLDWFGYGVAIDGNCIIVGAHRHDDTDTDCGAAYVFRYTGGPWAQEAKLLAADGAYGDNFGYSVALSGEMAVIGAYHDDDHGRDSGSVYVFRYDGSAWGQQAKLLAADGAANDFFGASVAASGDLIVVGAYGNDDLGAESGSVYVFHYVGGTWSQQAKLLSLDGGAGDNLGVSVAISGRTVLAGAYLDDDPGADSGSAYAFGVLNDCNGNSVPDDCDIAAGTSRDYDLNGVPDECDPDCNQNGVPDGCDLDCGTGNCARHPLGCGASTDCQDNGVPDECDIALGISRDCNGNGVPDECDIATGTSTDYDLNGVPDECDPDCNQNGVPDACDLDCGTGNCASHPLGCGVSHDCQPNGVLDECDIANGASTDYNLNGVPDECDSDCNHNGVPDACDLDCGTGNCASYPLGCGGSQDCQPNGVPDDCDIASGRSEDCNANAIPDECDIASAFSSDCGPNGVPDECDTAFTQLFEVIPDDLLYGSNFGQSVAIFRDVAAVGSLGATGDVPPPCAGLLYIFRYGAGVWSLEAELRASDTLACDHFSASVGLYDDVAVAGAPHHDEFALPHCGSAYVFRCNGSAWTEECRLVDSDRNPEDNFGSSIAIFGNLIVVGAPLDDEFGAEDAGSVSVFRFNGGTWPQEAKLTVPGATQAYQFGYSVSACADVILVGAPGDDELATDSGAVYVYRYVGGWSTPIKLLPDEGTTNGRFGSSIALDGEVAVVGDPGADCAYAFRYDGTTWVRESRLAPEDPSGRVFGSSVAISGDQAVVGAPDDAVGETGSAYIFRFNGSEWVERATLLSSDGDPNDHFGYVGAYGGVTIVGAPEHTRSEWYEGAAYFFAARDDCNVNGIPDECDFAAGTSQDCNANGVPDECDLSTGVSDDCQPNDVLDECDIASATSTDYDRDGVPDECVDCNHNGVPDGCDLDCGAGDCANHPLGCGTSSDCQANGRPDECDIAVGFSRDCNANTIPDECDIAGGLSADCNANSVPDECDIATGASLDCNANGVPDECELGITRFAKLGPDDGTQGQLFGYRVALSRDVAVVGVYDTDHTYDTGEAYVFRYRDGRWAQEAKLLASDGQQRDFFGQSVAVSGDVIVVGAWGNQHTGNGVGSAYIYRYSVGGTWEEVAELRPPDGSLGYRFAFDAAISGDAVIIGDPYCPDFGFESGAAYIFRNSEGTWVQEARLLASDGAAYDHFGQSVAIAGNTAVVGAPNDDDPGYDTGSTYIFRCNDGNWVQESKLQPPDDEVIDASFGRSVGISGDEVIVGGHLNNYPADPDSARSAYVFRHHDDNWIQEARLIVPDPQGDESSGGSVAISGPVALIGAYAHHLGRGAVYVFSFDGTTWVQQTTLTGEDPGSHFGVSVAAFGGTYLVGAEQGHYQGVRSGAAYILKAPNDCNANGIPDDCDIAAGASQDCNANGVPDECDIATGVSQDVNGNGVPDECELRGDLNCDGRVNNFDITPFVKALTDPALYQEQYPNCYIMNADVNGDGQVNNFDITPFVHLLIGR